MAVWASPKCLKPRQRLYELLAAPSILCAYAGSALQLLVMGALLAWMSSFLSRYYGLGTDRAGLVAAMRPAQHGWRCRRRAPQVLTAP